MNKMKNFLFIILIVFLLNSYSLYGISWTKHTIDGNFDGARSMYACDIDSDGDIDILGAAYKDGITWWENDGTPQNGGWIEHKIDEYFDRASSVYACDIDGDGDMDVLGTGINNIAWWESHLNKVNVVCSLRWSINSGFDGIDGVNPNFGSDGDTFCFEVVYINSANKAPTIHQVWIDLNDDGDYNDAGEKIDMNYNSGSYNTGALYTANLSINEVGDRRLKYKFYFKYNNKYAVGKPSEDHYFYVIEYLCITKNGDTPGGKVRRNSVNIPVLAFKITDYHNHPIKTVKIANLGTMRYSIDIADVKLWNDCGSKAGVWDSGDVQINGECIYNSVYGTYEFTNLSIPSGTDIVVTIDIAPTAIHQRTFRGVIRPHYVICSNNGWNTNSITNANIRTSFIWSKWIRAIMDRVRNRCSMTCRSCCFLGCVLIIGIICGPVHLD